MSRDQLVNLVYSQICERAPFDERFFQENTQEWVFEPVEQMGAIMHKDGHIHIAILPAFRSRWATRRRIRELLGRAAQNGKVYTETIQGDIPRQTFVERLGFHLITDGPIRLYGMTL